MDSRPSPLVAGLGLIALALVISAFFLGRGIGDVRRASDQVTVTGSARRPIRSDFVIWRASVSAQEPALATASQTLRKSDQRVRAFLTQAGVPDSIVRWTPVETSAIPEVVGDGKETGRIVGYKLTETFELRSADVAGITQLSQRASDLMAEGIPLVASPPEYLYTRLAEIRIALLADATTDARLRAERIAASAGGRVGPVRDVRMGVFQITPRYSTEVSDSGINDTSSIDKDVTAVVRVTFGVR